MPILPDIYGLTPLHNCYGIEEIIERKGFNGIFKPVKTSEEKTKNFAMGDLIFKSIADYGLMHSSFYLCEPILKAVKM